MGSLGLRDQPSGVGRSGGINWAVWRMALLGHAGFEFWLRELTESFKRCGCRKCRTELKLKTIPFSEAEDKKDKG